ncbi:hypothetical protein SanaruYs_38700 [Chryseotalea sanaruensis]|uniref:Uncharacterized protein n=1 Tax=Chryseotalea sanaruensis TaxID=2482724 RepID=A0A401UFD1_9BACT|nr:hypothetical protein [Chryseotalea sanaruensis]GCC53625.1 hypothetical protein SanaruYs_38700 [Chryseotalea sanaruensis]
MDESTRKVCEDILREKILSLQCDYESRITKLQQEHEAALSKVKTDEALKREQLETEYQQKLDLLQKEYHQKTKDLESEITFLNERHDSQRLMLSDTFNYVERLENELSSLKKTIAKGDEQAG